ncbi:MAG: alanine--tRNA ligase [Peptococcaceae bacterium]|nr:alanine--tRNA ligase [Peptococcaceae bacterium]
MMTGNEIREKFLRYFESKGHQRVASSSLVPFNDPTLLFTNAGMNQFKDVFLGLEKRPYSRATTAQKCVRAGGKHNDLDTVGRTARHHTFFEMLGNFSFGDYFKEDAIRFAWEFLTVEMGLPQDKLYITIYQDDDEACELWQKLTPVPAERIIRLGEKDNFWAMGDTGPCGPCSEIHIDRGPEYSCGPNCGIGKCDCDRFLEIWNLVFMQYNRDAEGRMTPLPRPSIDTGMGLERITSVVQHAASNYDTDIMLEIMHAVEKVSGKPYYKDMRGFPFRVIADHIRSCTFLISDGVLPSNEGRGYVLRRILRRAIRFGKVLGIDGPFMNKLVPVVVQQMGGAYPELKKTQASVERVIKGEEERFGQTLDAGIKLAQDIVAKVRAQGGGVLPGEDMFRLYDTYGFPFDLSQDIAEEAGLKVDMAGFEAAMDKQRQMSKGARKDVGAWDLALMMTRLSQGPATRFVGYDCLEAKSKAAVMVREGELVDWANEGEEVYMIMETTPFYAESGGQVADIGRISGKDGHVDVGNVTKLPDGRFVHQGRVRGQIHATEEFSLTVDGENRRRIAANHTVTHLLHKALRTVLGSHVYQAGSVVESRRLRFDFAHFNAMTPEEISRVEVLVNQAIFAAYPVTTEEKDIEQAKEEGATALFGEKYGEKVRVVTMGDFSKELCGGTHLKNTALAGLFKIVSEGAVSAGIRRIEGVTGQGVLELLEEKEAVLNEISAVLKTPVGGLEKKIQNLLENLRQTEKALEQAEAKTAALQSGQIMDKVVEISGVRSLITRVEARDMDSFRALSDTLKDKLGSGILVIGTVMDEKVSLIVTISKDLAGRKAHAGNLIKEIAKVCGGGGGGRPDMAQAGAKDPGQLDAALAKAREIIASQLA